MGDLMVMMVVVVVVVVAMVVEVVVEAPGEVPVGGVVAEHLIEIRPVVEHAVAGLLQLEQDLVAAEHGEVRVLRDHQLGQGDGGGGGGGGGQGCHQRFWI